MTQKYPSAFIEANRLVEPWANGNRKAVLDSIWAIEDPVLQLQTVTYLARRIPRDDVTAFQVLLETQYEDRMILENEELLTQTYTD